MKVANCCSNLRSIKFSFFFWESFLTTQVSVEFTSSDEVHEEIDPDIFLEHILHVYYEWMLNVKQDILLQLDVVVLLIINDNIFSDALHSIDVAIGRVLY